MNETIEVLETRRSVRKYQDRQVDEEALQQIIDAGLNAACGMNKQESVMVVIQDPETIATLSKMNAAVMGGKGDPFYGAPTVIVVLGDPNVPIYVEDASLVIGNLMNAAHALDVDSCWIHRANEEFASDEGKALLEKWGLPTTLVGVGHCILGYREGDYPKPIERREGRVVRVG